MNNFEFEHNGEKLWYSRSLAVALYLFTKDKYGKLYILVNHRGQGCEFNKGLWNVPGGFIDFDEDALKCAERECLEETGFKVNLTDVDGKHYAHPILFHLDTNPKTHPGRQTMVAIYKAEVPWKVAMGQELTWRNSEPGEVDDIRWLPVELVHSKRFVKGQEKTINQLIETYYRYYGCCREDMTWREFYKLPLQKDKLCGGNVITHIENDEYHEAWDWIENSHISEYPVDGRRGEQLSDAIVRYVNGESEYRPDFTWTKDESDPVVICMNGEPCMCIRGWGELFGALDLPYEKAAKIQDDFINFLIKRLNGEI